MTRKLLIAAGIVAGALVLAVIALLLIVDANRFKPRLEQAVNDATGRRLAINGDLSLKLLPHIALALPPTTLSTRDGQRTAASVQRARVEVALLPLLRGEVAVGVVRIEGLKATIERRADGTTSIDDLLGRGPGDAGAAPKAGGAAPRPLAIGGIELTDAELSFDDRAAGRSIRLTALSLTIGRVAPSSRTPVQLDTRFAIDQPRLEGSLQAKGTALLDRAQGEVAIESLVAAASARLADAAYALDARAGELRYGKLLRGRHIEIAARVEGPTRGRVTLDIPSLEGTAAQATIDTLRLGAELTQGSRRFSAALASPARAHIEAQRIELPKLSGELALEDASLPAGGIKLPLAGSAAIDAVQQTARLQLDTRLDDSRLAARVDIAGFDAPRVDFGVDADRLNLDRYLPRRPAPPAASGGPAPTVASGSAAPASPGGDTRVDLGFLRGLNVAGDVRVGELQAFNVKASNVRAAVKAAGGRLRLAPVVAQLYGGSINAGASAEAAGNRVALDADLAGVSIRPLLKDAIDADLLEGRGNVKLALAAGGASVAAMKRAAAGTVSVRLVDGAIRGIDLGRILRDARSLMATGRRDARAADAEQKTDFTELSANVTIKDGVAYNDDLDGKAPLFRLGGAGRADIGAETLDYTLRVSVVGTSRGQGGRELDELHGVTIPVRLTGAFAQPAWEIDWAAVALDVAKSTAGERLKDRGAKLLDRLFRK
jgi:AsmA protein